MISTLRRAVVLVALPFLLPLAYGADSFSANFLRHNGTHSELQVGITEYKNPQTGVVVTLIPMVHIGEQKFYELAESILEQQEIVLYEGVRPSWFFGPPFEEDPALTTLADYETRTKLRMGTIANMIRTYKKKNGAMPKTWQQALGDRYENLVNTLFFDAWGQPFILSVLPNGTLEVTSKGTPHSNPPQEIRLSELKTKRSYLLAKAMGTLMGLYSVFAKQTHLVRQSPFAVYSRAGSYNIDVSLERIFDVPIWKIFSLGERWRARNQYPVGRMTALLQQNGVSNKRIGIIYGAAHASDFHVALTKELGFEVAGKRWETIIESDDSLPQSVRNLRTTLISKLFKKMRARETCEEALLENIELP